MKPLFSIQKVCQTIAGIDSILFFETSNISGGLPPPSVNAALTYVDPAKVYALTFERDSGKYSDQQRSSLAGDYYDYNLSAFIPKRRAEMEILRSRLRHLRVCGIYVGRDGFQGLIWNAKFSAGYESGDRMGTRNGYAVSFTGSTIHRLPVIEGSVSLPDPIGGDGGSESDECCILIHPTPLDYVPDPTGNTEHLSRVVVGSDGVIYFIDAVGRSIVLGGLPPRYYSITVPDGLTEWIVIPNDRPLPDPDDYPPPGYDTTAEISKRLWVYRGQDKLIYGVDFTIQFTMGQQRLYCSPDLNADTIRVWIWNIPRTAPLILTIDPEG